MQAGITIITLCFMAEVTVNQGTSDIVGRFGKFTRTLSPGLGIVLPIVDCIGAKLNMVKQRAWTAITDSDRTPFAVVTAGDAQ
jgi:regulator of protease activity HflC (stomatin/prohibitin superfamily)